MYIYYINVKNQVNNTKFPFLPLLFFCFLFIYNRTEDHSQQILIQLQHRNCLLNIGFIINCFICKHCKHAFREQSNIFHCLESCNRVHWQHWLIICTMIISGQPGNSTPINWSVCVFFL